MFPKLKYILSSIVVVTLFLPMIQLEFKLIDIDQLQGGVTIAQKPEFNKDNYWDLKYQEEYNNYINDNFGFRPWLVKLVNQVRFTFFHSTSAPGVVIGKDDELFIESYIDDYIGRNYIGINKITETVNKIKCVQDSLKARGIDLIIVFAPGKATFNAEFIPDTYLSKKKDSTNYSVYSALLNLKQVNFIDFNKWFLDNKNKFIHPIYPKYGTHWNHYGMCLAIDSLNKYIEQKRGINIPDFDYSMVNYNTNLRGNDFDIGVLMNLAVPIEKDPNPYPIYKFKNGDGYTKPDVLVVGDSYWWCPVGDNLPIHFYREDEYWFYNKDQLIHNEKRKKVKSLNFSSALTQRQAIVIMATEATFYMFPYGFIDKAYTLYCEDHSARLLELKNSISGFPDWFNAVVQKAKDNNRLLDIQIKMEAEYILSDELLNPKENIEAVKQRIKSNPDWMKDIVRKAKENNITIDEQLTKDAQWEIDNKE